MPSLRIRTPPGVWPPHNDAKLLAHVLARGGWARQADALDLFTGSGVLAVSAARLGARSVLAIDVSRRALAGARLNAWRNHVAVGVRRSDLFASLDDLRFDLILANPPYYLGDGAPGRGLRRAWDGGPRGRALIDAVCRTAPGRLRCGGRLLMVHATFNGEQETIDLLTEAGLQAEVLYRHRGAFGAVGRAQLARLGPAAGGAQASQEEETIVVCATRRDR